MRTNGKNVSYRNSGFHTTNSIIRAAQRDLQRYAQGHVEIHTEFDDWRAINVILATTKLSPITIDAHPDNKETRLNVLIERFNLGGKTFDYVTMRVIPIDCRLVSIKKDRGHSLDYRIERTDDNVICIFEKPLIRIEIYLDPVEDYDRLQKMLPPPEFVRLMAIQSRQPKT